MKKCLLLFLCCTALSVWCAKPFELNLTPGVTEYTVEAPESGTYWFHAYTIAKVPVGKQHFADLRWDEDLPMNRRLLQANQTEKSMKLDRVTFEKGKPRRLYFSYDNQSVTVKRIRFTKLVPRRPPKAVVSYKVPFDPPARHPRVLVDPALVKKLKKNLEHPENLPAWEKIRKNALAPYSFAPSPDRELAFDKNVVAVLREKAFYYLMTGDRKVGREAIDLAKSYMTKVTFGNGQDICRKSGESIFSTALVYDWCYPLLSAAEKQLLLSRMLYYAVEMEVGWPPFRQSAAIGHGNEAQISRDLLAMAIAVWNEDPEPYRFVMYQMLENLKPYKAYSYRSGRHSQGTGYGQHRGSFDMFAALQFRRTFKQELLPPEAAKFPYMWYYLRLPDGRFTPEGDANWTWKAAYTHLNPILIQCAIALYRDPELKSEFFRRHLKLRIADPVLYLLTNDPELKPEDRRADLPLTKWYNDPLPGLYVRTGWNFAANADDAVISMQGAHTHFRNHQHRDAGAFQIYYRGNLASDFSQYQTYGVPYDVLLSKPSALHSLMRFVDPAGAVTRGKLTVNTGSQTVTGTSPANLDILLQPQFRNGETPRAGFGPDAQYPLYNFMEVDLARVFAGRVKAYSRTFVFLNQSSPERPGTLIVLDRFTPSRPEIKPIFQLATIERPVWKNDTLQVRNSMHGKTGVLTMKTLVPEKVHAAMFTAEEAHTFGGVYVAPRNAAKKEASGTRTELTGPGNVFLNVLQIHGGEVSPLPAQFVKSGGRYDITLADYFVSLGNTAELTEKMFQITVPQKEAKVLLQNLAPGKWTLAGNGEKRVFEVAKREGSLFTLLKKGVYTLSPGGSGKVESAPALRAVPAPPPPRNQLIVDGIPFPGVRTEVRGGVLSLPLTKPAKDASGSWFLPPWEYTLKKNAVNICGYDFPLSADPGQEKFVPAEWVGVLTGREAFLDEISGNVRFVLRNDHSGILHAFASDEAENLRQLLFRKKGAWITLGRNITAEIVFANNREIAGVELDLPNGKTRRQFLAIEAVYAEKAETVFDGETDGKSKTFRISFAPRRVRALRFRMKGNSVHEWNNISGIRFLLPEDQRITGEAILNALPRLQENLRKILLEDLSAAQLNAVDVLSASRKAGELLKNFQSDGTWSDINYQDRSRSAWNPRVHLLRMKALAVTHPEAAKKALKAWAERDPYSPNWWNRNIGTPEAICHTLILLGGSDAVSPELSARLRTLAERSYDVHPKVGQNLVWLSGVRLMIGILWKEAEAVRTGSEIIKNELCIVPTGEEGLQSDYSFHQHGIQLQVGNYGLGYFGNHILWMRALGGTVLAYPARKAALLDHYLMDCLRWTWWDGSMEPSACGRMVLPHMMKARGETLIRLAGQLAPLLPPERKTAVQNWLKDPEKLTGSAVFPNSGYMIFRADAGWKFSLKMCSPELIGSETVNGQNLRALYQADGALFFGNMARYRDFHVLCDARKLPGTTEIMDERPLTGQVAPRNIHGYYAMLADFPAAIAAFRHAPGDMTADKVWFCTSSGVWCSGSDIQSRSRFPVVTAVDQFRTGEAALAVDVPAGFPAVTEKTLEMTGDEKHVMRESASQKRTGNMTLLTIDHGIAPQKAVYRYRMRRATDPVKPETWLKTSSSRIHALAAENRILTAAFVPGEITLKNGKKCPVTPGIAILDAAGNVLQRSGFRVK